MVENLVINGYRKFSQTIRVLDINSNFVALDENGVLLMKAILNLQKEKVPSPRRRKYVKLLIPVNLRKIFPSKSLRNFVLYVNPELDPRLGDYTFEEMEKMVDRALL